MTHYVRRPNTFDELAITSSTTVSDVTTFFGQTYDANRFSLNFVGLNSPGNFVLVLYKAFADNPQELVYTNPGGYLRAERRRDGTTVDIAWAPEPLSTDPQFEQD